MSTANTTPRRNLMIHIDDEPDNVQESITQNSPRIQKYPFIDSIDSIKQKKEDFSNIKGRTPYQKENNYIKPHPEPPSYFNRESSGPDVPLEPNSLMVNGMQNINNGDNEEDEFEEHLMYHSPDQNSMMKTSPIKSPSKRTMTNVTVVHSGTSTPYSSAIHINPFAKRKNIMGQFDTLFMKQDDSSDVDIRYSPLSHANSHSNELSLFNTMDIKTQLEHNLKFSSRNSSRISSVKLGSYMYNTKILEFVTRFLCPADLLYLQFTAGLHRNPMHIDLFKKRLYQSIKFGMSRIDQRRFWKYFVNFERIKEQHPYTFTGSFVKRSIYLREINKDLDRTLQDDPFFQREEGKNSLFRVLVAISNTVIDVGYIQGLNSIVGTFLLYLKEEDTYWMMLYLLRKRELKNLICLHFPLVELWNYQLKCFMQIYVPDVYDFIVTKGMTIEYYSTPWFLTLFTYHFQIPIVMKIWNLYFIRGEGFFIQLALAVFAFYKKDILARDIDELGDFLKRNMKDLFIEDTLIDMALDFKVTKRLLNQLRSFFGQVEVTDKLTLKFDDLNKLNFVEEPPQVPEYSLLLPLKRLDDRHESGKNRQEGVDGHDEDVTVNSHEKDHHNPSENLKTDSNGSDHVQQVDDPELSPIKSEVKYGENGKVFPKMLKNLINVMKIDGFSKFGRLFKGTASPGVISRKESLGEEVKSDNSISKSAVPLAPTRVLDDESSQLILNLETIHHHADLASKENPSDISFIQFSHKGPHRYTGTKFTPERPTKKELDSPSPIVQMDGEKTSPVKFYNSNSPSTNGSPSHHRTKSSSAKYENYPSKMYTSLVHKPPQYENTSSFATSNLQYRDDYLIRNSAANRGFSCNYDSKRKGSSPRFADSESDQEDNVNKAKTRDHRPLIKIEKIESIDKSLQKLPDKIDTLLLSPDSRKSNVNSAKSFSLNTLDAKPCISPNSPTVIRTLIDGIGGGLEENIKEDILQSTQTFVTKNDKTNGETISFPFIKSSFFPTDRNKQEYEYYDSDFNVNFLEYKPNAPN